VCDARTGQGLAVAALLVAVLFPAAVFGQAAQTPPPGQAQPKAASESKESDEEKKGLSLADLGLKGRFIVKNYSFLRELARDDNIEVEAILQLEWNRKLPAGHRFKFVGEIREDDAGKVWGVNERFPDTRQTRSAMGVKEAVLSLDFSPVRLGLGKQKYSWGTGDAFNPTDNLNPWDEMDPVDREKLAVWSASATVDAYDVNFQFVIVPTFSTSKEPLPNSRWVQTRNEGALDPGQAIGLAGAATLAAGTTIGPRRTIFTDWDTPQYGARAKSTVKGWDVSVSYYDGYEPTPVLQRERIVQPVFSRIKAPGADFSTTWKKFEFHGEGAFKLEERRAREDRFHGLLGLNYTLDELGLDWLEQIIFVLEHARETHLTSIKHRRYTEYPGLSSAFRDALITRAIIKFNQDTEAAAGVVMDFVRSANYYAQAKVTHKFADWFHVDLGGDFFGGDHETFWGKWHKNDRFFVVAKYIF
jgi:hypothetical protein